MQGTRFHKRFIPVLWVAFAGALLLMWLSEAFKRRFDSELLFAFAIVAVGGYFVMKTSVWCLVDEVWDETDALIVRNEGREARIDLQEIQYIDCSMCSRPEIVTLVLREPCVFGMRIKFLAKERFFQWGDPPVVKELQRRLNERRQREAQGGPLTGTEAL